jgi:general stress protein CsbA
VLLLLMMMMTMVTYSEYVSVALVVQHAKHMRRIVICDRSGFIILFHSDS